LDYYGIAYLACCMMLAIVVTSSHAAIYSDSELQRKDAYRMAKLAMRYAFGSGGVLALASAAAHITQYR
jgi:hypothetical protein